MILHSPNEPARTTVPYDEEIVLLLSDLYNTLYAFIPSSSLCKLYFKLPPLSTNLLILYPCSSAAHKSCSSAITGMERA